MGASPYVMEWNSWVRKSLRPLVGVEDGIDAHPNVAVRLASPLYGEIDYGVVDGSEEPATDTTVGLVPIGIKGRR